MLELLRRYHNFLGCIGLDSDRGRSERKAVAISSQLAGYTAPILLVVAVLSFVADFYFRGEALLISNLFMLAYGLLLAATLAANHFHFFGFTRMMFAFFNPIFFAAAGVTFGEGLYLGATIIVVAPSIFLVSTPRHKILQVATIFAHAAAFLFVTYWHNTREPLVPAPADLIEFTSYGLGLVALFVVYLMVFVFYHNTNEAEQFLEEERAKSDKLLLNILPDEIAAELREKGSARPLRYESVTVLFTDFVGFTRISEGLTPEELIDELDKCFSYFDAVTQKYNLEKIKTIGDSYMLAGGLPKENQTHAVDCVLAAMEVQAFMTQMKQLKEQTGFPYWELRLGINTGPLVAGVIAEMKFQYDVFGDTVNTASRLETAGEPGKINISHSTYDRVQHLFTCTHRGKVDVKHKGEIDMYFVEGLRPEFSVDGDGKVPNDRFRAEYDRL